MHQRARRRDQPLAQLVVDRLVHEDALHADAALARLVEGAEDDALDGVVEVGVSSTITAALPPSSSTTFFLPARAFSVPADLGRAGEAQQLQALVGREQVGAVAPARQDRERAAAAGRSRPAPRRSAARRSGVRLAGFSTNGQPTAIAGAILCAARLSGKLNGEMNEHGPDRHALPHARCSRARAARCPAAAPRRRSASTPRRRCGRCRSGASPRRGCPGSACRPRCTAPAPARRRAPRSAGRSARARPGARRRPAARIGSAAADRRRDGRVDRAPVGQGDPRRDLARVLVAHLEVGVRRHRLGSRASRGTSTLASELQGIAHGGKHIRKDAPRHS